MGIYASRELRCESLNWLWHNERFFDGHDQMMNEHTQDALTLTSRIYEATRLPRSLLEGVRLVWN